MWVGDVECQAGSELAMRLHQMRRLPRKLPFAVSHTLCTLSPLDAALTLQFAKTRNTTRLKCLESAAPAAKKCKSSSDSISKVLSIVPVRQNDLRRVMVVMKHVGMSQSATPATHNQITTSFETFKKGFAASPICTGTPQPENRDETCQRLKTSSTSHETSSTFLSL